MAIFVTHACRTCHSVESVSACMRCHTAFYCSNNCQTLDWKVHKKFCINSESQAHETDRRNRCLELIQQTGFKFLMRQQFHKETCFLVAQENKTPLTLLHVDFSVLKAMKMPVTELVYAELAMERERKTEKMSMTVLYLDKTTAKVYVVSSNKFVELHQSVMKMPHDVVAKCLEISFQNETKQNPLVHNLLTEAMLEHQLKTGKAPTESGGFFEEFAPLFTS